jgi:hypothetical protein
MALRIKSKVVSLLVLRASVVSSHRVSARDGHRILP